MTREEFDALDSNGAHECPDCQRKTTHPCGGCGCPPGPTGYGTRHINRYHHTCAVEARRCRLTTTKPQVDIARATQSMLEKLTPEEKAAFNHHIWLAQALGKRMTTTHEAARPEHVEAARLLVLKMELHAHPADVIARALAETEREAIRKCADALWNNCNLHEPGCWLDSPNNDITTMTGEPCPCSAGSCARAIEALLEPKEPTT